MIRLSNIDDAFWPALVRGARGLGVDPRTLAGVMLSESDLNPRAFNANGGAVGINQFMPATLANVAPGLSSDIYRTLSASQQLAYALAFWRALYNAHPGAREGGARDLYWLNFLPATFVPHAPDSYVLTRNPTTVAANPSLVLPGDSENVIRAGGLTRALDSAVKRNSTRWAATLENIEETEAATGMGTAMGWSWLLGGGLALAGLTGLGVAIWQVWPWSRSWTSRRVK
jgi:hypothetical protein